MTPLRPAGVKEDRMKHLLRPFVVLALCASVALLPTLSSAADQSKASQIAKLDGYVWQDTSNDNKLSFLFGLENGIAVEYAIGMEQAKRNGKQPTLENLNLSPFERGWVIAFENTPRQTIVDGIDTFYDDNPDQKDRHVLDVVWKELIVPALPAGK